MNVQDAINRIRAIKTFVATLPDDLSAYPDIADSEDVQFPNAIGYKGKSIPINWDGTTITLAT